MKIYEDDPLLWFFIGIMVGCAFMAILFMPGSGVLL